MKQERFPYQQNTAIALFQNSVPGTTFSSTISPTHLEIPLARSPLQEHPSHPVASSFIWHIVGQAGDSHRARAIVHLKLDQHVGADL